MSRTPLGDLRAEIDEVDRRIVTLLRRRQGLVEQVARLKGDPARVLDRRRAAAVIAKVRRAARTAGLAPGLAGPLWRLIVRHSAEHEIRLLRRPSAIACDRQPKPPCR